jgi:hypothetical protein
MKEKEEGLRPEGIKYLGKRVVAVLLSKQHQYLEDMQKKHTEAQRVLIAKESAYLKTLPAKELAEALAGYMYDRQHRRAIDALANKVKRKFRPELRALAKLDINVRHRRSYPYDEQLIPLFAKKRDEVLDELVLGDQKKALGVLAQLEKWNP